MSEITEVKYTPPDSLEPLLVEAASEIKINYAEEREFDLGPSEATQRDYSVTYEGFELDGTETLSAVGVLLSLDGHLGLTATTILISSLKYGAPTLLYMDEEVETTAVTDHYEDISAEWYFPQAVDQGLHESRMESRPDRYEANMMEIDQLEEWAEQWLSLDSTE
jgi:hypothetical protein